MTALLQGAFDQLAAQIKASADCCSIIYIPNPGNFGDGLIRHATKAFLLDHGIAHTEVPVGSYRDFLSLLPLLSRQQHFFIYGGGGAWHPGCPFGYRACRFMSLFRVPLLVLPTTIALDPKGINAVMYRRDNGISREWAPEAQFCHDMALYLFLRERKAGAMPAHRELIALRTDNESTREGKLPAENRDVSQLGNHLSNAERLLEIIDEYETVTTDRLHVAIAGLLLSKKVTLFPGNYPKIADVVEASLAMVGGERLRFERSSAVQSTTLGRRAERPASTAR